MYARGTAATVRGCRLSLRLLPVMLHSISLPLHIIAVPLAAPALLVLYGKQYLGALLVASVAPLLCLPKAFAGIIQSLFESVDKQKYFIYTTVFASFV